MVDRITSSLAREAILSAIDEQSRAARSIQDEAREMFDAALATQSGTPGSGTPGSGGVGVEGGTSRAPGVVDGLNALDQQLQQADPDRLAAELVSGEIKGFHELAARINTARISFEFAMEVRNKLIDAYRETMRMTV